MANILISYYKIQEIKIGKTLCIWEGLSKKLKETGNNVLLINSAFCNKYRSNIPANKNVAQYILNKTIDFKPDFIIAFNNRIPKNILEYFSEIPIIMWDGDDPSYICDPDYIKQNMHKYQIFTIVKDWYSYYLEMGIPKDKIHFVPVATAVEANKQVEQKYNISFCGSIPYYDQNFKKIISDENFSNTLRKNIIDFLIKPNYHYKESFDKLCPQNNFNVQALYPAYDYRWLTLGNMLDLGLVMADSIKRWNDGLNYFPQLVAMLLKDYVWNLDDNNMFYNSSKVSLSIHHPQALGCGFSWRCFDVMASNACLLTTTSTDLKVLFKGKVDIPMFDTPYQAREQAIKLLNDECYRNDIVLASQEFVEQECRWESRFKTIQDILNISIFNPQTNSHVFLNTMTELLELCNISQLESTKNKKNTKNTIIKKAEFPSVDKKQLNLKNKILYKCSRYLYQKIKTNI